MAGMTRLQTMVMAILAALSPCGAFACTVANLNQAGGDRSASPDGRWVAYAARPGPSDDDRAVLMLRRRKGPGHPIRLRHIIRDGEVAWTPDSRSLIYIDTQDEDYGVEVFDMSSNGVRRTKRYDDLITNRVARTLGPKREITHYDLDIAACRAGGFSLKSDVRSNLKNVEGAPDIEWGGRFTIDLRNKTVHGSIHRTDD